MYFITIFTSLQLSKYFFCFLGAVNNIQLRQYWLLRQLLPENFVYVKLLHIRYEVTLFLVYTSVLVSNDIILFLLLDLSRCLHIFM